MIKHAPRFEFQMSTVNLAQSTICTKKNKQIIYAENRGVKNQFI
jgi:hypothetical protein